MNQELQEVIKEAKKKGIYWDDDIFKACFGKGTYRWLIQSMGISYLEGMDIGLFDLHQNYNRGDLQS